MLATGALSIRNVYSITSDYFGCFFMSSVLSNIGTSKKTAAVQIEGLRPYLDCLLPRAGRLTLTVESMSGKYIPLKHSHFHPLACLNLSALLHKNLYAKKAQR